MGGNIGDTATLFDQALNRLEDRRIHVSRMSPILHSTAMGSSAGDDFLNAAAVVETTLEPDELLQQLHQIEADLGRQRSIRWGPRVIDLDLLLYDQKIIDTSSLVIPHPAMWYRRFVLEPLMQIAPEFQHPILDESIRQLRSRLDQRPLRIVVGSTPAIDLDLSHVQGIIDKQFGDAVIALHTEPQTSDDTFATVTLNNRANSVSGNRTQPSHQPKRTICISPDGGDVRTKMIETITDVCAAAIG